MMVMVVIMMVVMMIMMMMMIAMMMVMLPSDDRSDAGAEHGEGVTDPETVFDGAARGDVNYVHFCLEANESIISNAHGAERSSLLHVASNTGNTVLMQVRCGPGQICDRFY